jgi:hypothetical protein
VRLTVSNASLPASQDYLLYREVIKLRSIAESERAVADAPPGQPPFLAEAVAAARQHNGQALASVVATRNKGLKQLSLAREVLMALNGMNGDLFGYLLDMLHCHGGPPPPPPPPPPIPPPGDDEDGDAMAIE